MLNLMKLVFYLLLYVHGVGCFWWLTVSMGYPDMYYIDLKNNLYVHSDINVGLDLTANDEKLKKQYAYKDPETGLYKEITNYD